MTTFSFSLSLCSSYCTWGFLSFNFVIFFNLSSFSFVHSSSRSSVSAYSIRLSDPGAPRLWPDVVNVLTLICWLLFPSSPFPGRVLLFLFTILPLTIFYSIGQKSRSLFQNRNFVYYLLFTFTVAIFVRLRPTCSLSIISSCSNLQSCWIYSFLLTSPRCWIVVADPGVDVVNALPLTFLILQQKTFFSIVAVVAFVVSIPQFQDSYSQFLVGFGYLSFQFFPHDYCMSFVAVMRL